MLNESSNITVNIQETDSSNTTTSVLNGTATLDAQCKYLNISISIPKPDLITDTNKPDVQTQLTSFIDAIKTKMTTFGYKISL